MFWEIASVFIFSLDMDMDMDMESSLSVGPPLSFSHVGIIELETCPF